MYFKGLILREGDDKLETLLELPATLMPPLLLEILLLEEEGDKDCLAVMEALESLCFNCLAIFSKSSFFNGVLGSCLRGADEPSSFFGEELVDKLDVLGFSRSIIYGALKCV